MHGPPRRAPGATTPDQQGELTISKPETVRITEVRTGTKNLTVSTIKIGRGYYDTVIVDNHDDKRHSGMRLPAHEAEGRRHGPWIIDKLNIRADTREEAMDDHREALYAARTETPA